MSCEVKCGVLSFTETSETSTARASEEIWRPFEHPTFRVSRRLHPKKNVSGCLRGRSDENVSDRGPPRRDTHSTETLKTVSVFLCLYNRPDAWRYPKIVEYYRHKWQIETAFRDVKQHFGFDAYRVKSRKSINRWVQLSFVAASLTKLVFLKFGSRQASDRVSVKEVCEHLGIHWYHPRHLTQGVRVAYLQSQLRALEYSASSQEKTNSQNIHSISEHDTTLPLDKAA